MAICPWRTRIPSEASGRQGIAIADEVHRVGGGDNLTLLVSRLRNGKQMSIKGASALAIFRSGILSP